METTRYNSKNINSCHNINSHLRDRGDILGGNNAKDEEALSSVRQRKMTKK